MKTAITAILLVILSSFTMQTANPNAYICKTGKIHFFSDTPVEDIEATSNAAFAVLYTDNQKITAKVKMESFAFEKKLMEEHFNENYIESEKYPYGVLEGTIVEKLDWTKDGTYNVTVRGSFEVHGVKQNRDIKGTVTIKGGVPTNAKAKFDVKLEDHKIKIPKAVIMNIAEVITVDVDFNFVKYAK